MPLRRSRLLLSPLLLCLLSMSAGLRRLVLVLILILVLPVLVVFLLILLLPLLMMMMFLSTLWHMKRPTAFFQDLLPPRLLRVVLLVVVVVAVVRRVVVVVELAARQLVWNRMLEILSVSRVGSSCTGLHTEMRSVQNRTLEPESCLSRSTRWRRPSHRRR